jgi:fibronectin type 3 domain-containing protein
LRKIALLFVLFSSLASAAQAGAGFTKIANVTTTTATDSTCPNQSTCYYQVTALDNTGHESAPASCGSTALCLGGNQVVAQMPSSGTHTVTLTWTASTSTGVTYNVYQHIGPFPPSNLSPTVN